MVECELLKMQVEQLQSESEVIDWYVDIMEKGIDTKKIVEEHIQLKHEFAEYRAQKDLEIPVLEKSIEKLQKDNLKA